jgi:suppressor for copper-sensitivity B
MRADWTRRDTRIGDYLKTYGRYGIPFNVVYGPAAPGGVPLPELLTEAAVLEALRQASGRTS